MMPATSSRLQKLGSDGQSAQTLIGHHGLDRALHTGAFRPWPWGPGSHRHTRTNVDRPVRTLPGPALQPNQRPAKYGASANPLLHLKRVDAAGWFDNYAQSFKAVWATARPWTPDQEGPSSHGQD